MARKDSLYFGKSCEHRVFAELLKRGFDVYVPLLDNKVVDCIAEKDGKKFKIQIKGRQPRWIFNIGKINKSIDYFILLPPDDKIYCVPTSQIIEWLHGKNKFNFDTADKKKDRDAYLGFEALK